MFLRTTQRRNRDSSVIRYLQLAHNERGPGQGAPKAKILYSFGREDQLDRDAIRRLISSLSRALDPGEVLSLPSPDLEFVESRPLGGAYVLDQVWQRLGLHTALTRLLRGRRLDPRAERVLFAMVANRALEPLSKLACTTWVEQRAAFRARRGHLLPSHGLAARDRATTL